jgi:hypothetical protein
VAEFLLSGVGVYPFSCNVCGQRTFGSQTKQVLAVLLVIAVISGIGAGGWFITMRGLVRSGARIPRVLAASVGEVAKPLPQQAKRFSNRRILTNKDILELNAANVSSPMLIDLLHKVDHDFQVDTPSLVELKKAGVPENVILAMVELTVKSADGIVDSAPVGHMVR